MTATEELRRLLDERGVRWSSVTPRKTKWYSPVVNGPVAVGEWNDKLVLDTGYVDVTPEQAVAVTLGQGTCEVEGYDDGVDEGVDGEWYTYGPPTWHLSCGHETYGSERPCYCSACGAKVV